MTSTEFDNYIIYQQEEAGSDVKSVITCYMGDKTVGYITFYQGDVPDPEVLRNGALHLNFPASRFMEIVETIRYEKPLFISIYGKKSMLSTVREPVGEQEGHESHPAWGQNQISK